MNDELQKKLSNLESCITIQKDFINRGNEYQSGLYNGLILAHSIFADCKPNYCNPKRKKSKIRHKQRT
jgi:hypothetical protein